jgi:hypothetical protein
VRLEIPMEEWHHGQKWRAESVRTVVVGQRRERFVDLQTLVQRVQRAQKVQMVR